MVDQADAPATASKQSYILERVFRDGSVGSPSTVILHGRSYIGRKESCHLRLKSEHARKLVSKEHAVIFYEAETDKIILHDLDSTNGVAVNDCRITEAELHDGDIISFSKARGEFEYKFRRRSPTKTSSEAEDSSVDHRVSDDASLRRDKQQEERQQEEEQKQEEEEVEADLKNESDASRGINTEAGAAEEISTNGGGDHDDSSDANISDVNDDDDTVAIRLPSPVIVIAAETNKIEAENRPVIKRTISSEDESEETIKRPKLDNSAQEAANNESNKEQSLRQSQESGSWLWSILPTSLRGYFG